MKLGYYYCFQLITAAIIKKQMHSDVDNIIWQLFHLKVRWITTLIIINYINFVDRLLSCLFV